MAPETVRVLDGYLRQSQAAREDSVSIAQQQEKIEAWASLRGVRVGRWHTDRDTSGSTLERPALSDALERIKSGATEGIIVSDLSRLSRANVGDALKMFSLIHDDYGGTVVVVDLGGESVDPTTPTGEAIITIMLAMARLEWRMTAAKIEEGKRAAAREGKWLNRPPVGYTVDDNGFLEPSDEAPLVREIYKRVAADGLDPALDWLGREKGAGADPARRWTRAWITRVVGRRVYLGEAPWNGITRADAHDPLVDLATWTRANRQIAGRTVGERSVRESYPLSGAAVCAVCGDRMLGNLAGGYYRDAAGKKGPKREGATYVPGHRAYKARCEHRPYARADQLEAATRGLLIEMAEEFGDEPEMRVGGTSEVVVQAETALESAKLRRDADLTNLDLPAEALATRLAAHDAAIAGAEEAYGEALEAAEPEVAPSTAQEIAAMSLVELAQYLRRMYDAGAVVAVAPGKGDVAERLSIREASDFA